MYMYICNYAGFHSTDVHNYTELVYIHLPLHLLPLCRLVGKFMIVIPVATVCVLIGSFQRILYHWRFAWSGGQQLLQKKENDISV